MSIELNADPITHMEHFLTILREDLETYKYVTEAILINSKKQEDLKSQERKNEKIKGGLCVGMALTAFAGLDLLAFVYYGGELGLGDTGTNFNKLLDPTKHSFASVFQGVDHKIFYKILRNGLVHQLMPKNVHLSADIHEKNLLVKDSTIGDYTLNAYYLLQETVKGYDAIITEMKMLESLANDLSRHESALNGVQLQVRNLSSPPTAEQYTQLNRIPGLQGEIKRAKNAAVTLGLYKVRINALILNDNAAFLFAFEKLLYPSASSNIQNVPINLGQTTTPTITPKPQKPN